MKKRFLSILLALVLAGTLLPAAALELSPEGYGEEEWPADTVIEEGLPPETYGAEEWSGGIDPEEAASGSTVSLKNGEYVRWIDRIDVPDSILTFYAQLEEATDNDGIDDWFIDPSTAMRKTWDMSHTVDGVSIKASTTYAVIPVSCTVSNKDYIKACIYAARDAFIRDHPEVFWLSSSTGGIVSSASGNDVTLYYYFTREVNGYPSLSYDIRRAGFTTASAIKARIQEVDTAANAIIAAAGDTDYEKIRYFNNWLTTHNEYNTLASEDRDNAPYRCDTALLGSVGENGPTCMGYSTAFKVLCDRVGIPCVLVDSANHMWNYVELCGGWYAVDATWNDPVVNGKSGAVSGKESEKWLLLGATTKIDDEAFLKSHPAENAVSSDRVHFTNGPSLVSSAYVAPDTWAQADVEASFAAGIMTFDLQGDYTAGTTRAKFCTLAVNLYETVTGEEVTGRVTFTDTSDEDVEKAAYLGVVEGVGDGRFSPDSVLTREQATTMLARLAKALGKPLAAHASTFSDNSAVSTYALDAVGQVQGAGIMDGTGNNHFSPKSTYSWQQSIVTIMRLYDLVK